MYQTGFPTNVGRRRSKNVERQAEIMRQHFAAQDDKVILVGAAADAFAERLKEIGREAASTVPKRRGRPRKSAK